MTKEIKTQWHSAFGVAVTENEEMFADLRMEGMHMCEALRKLMKEDLDEAARLGEERGKRIGEEQGKKIGEERGRESIIMNVLKSNRTIEEVAELLTVPLEEVRAVAKKLLSEN